MSIGVVFEKLNFIISLMVAFAIMSHRLPRRNMFVLRIVSVVFVLCGLSLLRHFIPPIAAPYQMWVSVFQYFVLFVLAVVGLGFIMKADVLSYIFCGTAAYCVQHLSFQAYSIILQFIPSLNVLANILLLTLVCAVVYTASYFFLVKKKLKWNEPIEVDSKAQILVATCIVSVTVFISFFGAVYSMRQPWDGANIMLIVICLFSIMSCFLGLCTEFGLFAVRKMEGELALVKRILHAKSDQYQNTKENIQLINTKCHDLKHQISALKGKVSQEELDEISHAIMIYDSILKTGNEALDVVLKDKNLICVNKGIRLTCLLDGQMFNSFAERDLYSLFGNALENAIESVEHLDEEKRVVSISARIFNKFIDVKIENYYSGNLCFENGLPLTTKKDTFYHGFGVKSMKLVAEKYGGSLSASVNNDIFTLDIYLPRVGSA